MWEIWWGNAMWIVPWQKLKVENGGNMEIDRVVGGHSWYHLTCRVPWDTTTTYLYFTDPLLIRACFQVRLLQNLQGPHGLISAVDTIQELLMKVALIWHFPVIWTGERKCQPSRNFVTIPGIEDFPSQIQFSNLGDGDDAIDTFTFHKTLGHNSKTR